jgi:hypothetical protein
MRRLSHIVIATVVLALIAATGTAAAKGYRDVIRDCAQDGQLDHTYSQRELQQARKHIPSDVDEYTDCRSAIDAALARGNSGGGSGGGGNAPYNPSLTTPAGATAYNQRDYNSLKDAAKAAKKRQAPRITLGTGDAATGNSQAALLAGATPDNSMPSSALGALIAVGALTLLATALLVTRRWSGVRRVALRLFGR